MLKLVPPTMEQMLAQRGDVLTDLIKACLRLPLRQIQYLRQAACEMLIANSDPDEFLPKAKVEVNINVKSLPELPPKAKIESYEQWVLRYVDPKSLPQKEIPLVAQALKNVAEQIERTTPLVLLVQDDEGTWES